MQGHGKRSSTDSMSTSRRSASITDREQTASPGLWEPMRSRPDPRSSSDREPIGRERRRGFGCWRTRSRTRSSRHATRAAGRRRRQARSFLRILPRTVCSEDGRSWPKKTLTLSVRFVPIARSSSSSTAPGSTDSLGDAPSADLVAISHAAANRAALLTALSNYLKMWSVHPDKVTAADITNAYPGIRPITLKTSGLLVTYGELNTLPDYVANAGQADQLPSTILFPILQAVRQEGYANVRVLQGLPNDIPKFVGSVSANLGNGTMNDVWESYWLDILTADLPPDLPAGSLSEGTNMYGSILARNACHFAPYSWYRWGLAYDAALALAQQAYKTKDPQTIHDAWIQHGYADHFLQDSFAAGHLINKTLVMQWFVEWASQKWFESVPDWVESRR